MSEIVIALKNGDARGASLDLGPVKMVYARKSGGFLGCGIFDVAVLDRFGVAAANVRGVSTVEDLLAGSVSRVNDAAAAKGVRVGMTGREALELM